MTERKFNREGVKRNTRTDRNAYDTETKRKTKNTERNKGIEQTQERRDRDRKKC